MTDPILDMIQKTKAMNLASSETIERIEGDMVAELRKTSQGRKRLSEIVAERFGTEKDANDFLQNRGTGIGSFLKHRRGREF